MEKETFEAAGVEEGTTTGDKDKEDRVSGFGRFSRLFFCAVFGIPYFFYPFFIP